MATIEELLGPGSQFQISSGMMIFLIPPAVSTDPGLGGLEGSRITAGSSDTSPDGITPDQAIASLIRILHVNTNSRAFQEDSQNRVVSTGLSPGREQIDFNNPQLYDTYTFSIQVRQPSTGDDLPDPDLL